MKPFCKKGHERTPDNLNKNGRCKKCRSIYYKENSVKLLESKARYRKENAEKLRLAMAKWYEANKEKVRVYMAEYRKINFISFRLYAHKRRSSKKAVGGRLSRGLAAKLLALQKGKCRICKVKLLDGNFHLDHTMPISRGGLNVDSNIQILCQTCNQKKNAKLPHIHAQELGMLFL